MKQASVGTRTSQGLPVFGVRNERRWRRAGCCLGQEVKVEREWMFTRDTHAHTRELDKNTAKRGVTECTLLYSGCDQQNI